MAWKFCRLITAKHRHHDFGQLHELARHALHTTETLDVATDTIANLMSTISSLREPSNQSALSGPRQGDEDWLKTWLGMLKNIRRRADGLTARLSNEIGLVGSTFHASCIFAKLSAQAYNLTAQADSQANLRIAAAAQQDAAAMKLISIVTLAFLPATFVSVCTQSLKAPSNLTSCVILTQNQ